MQTRTKIFIVTLIATLIFASVLSLSINPDIFAFASADGLLGQWMKYSILKLFSLPIFISLIIFVGIGWVVKFNISRERYVTINAFAATNMFFVTLFFEMIFFDQPVLSQLTVLFVSTIIFAAITYILILTLNILNYSFENDIPLEQAARAAIFILSLVIHYILFFILFSNTINVFLRFLIIFFIVSYFSYSLLWTLKIEAYERYVSSLGIGSIMLLFSVILSIWPVGSEIISFILSLLLYVTLGIAMELREKVSKYIWVEYILLILIIFSSLLLLSDWGINGHLI